MAGLSQQVSPSDVLPLLAHQVVVDGYQGSAATEYLLLIQRYLVQAKQVETLAGPSHTIRIEKCEDTAKLFLILGYQLRHGCTQDIVLEAGIPTVPSLRSIRGSRWPIWKSRCKRVFHSFTSTHPLQCAGHVLHLSVRVVLVELDIAVTDQKGNYVRGLKPEDFAIVEDAIPEKMATFEEGNETPRILLQHPSKDAAPVMSTKAWLIL